MFAVVGKVLQDRGVASDRVSDMVEAFQGVCVDNLSQSEQSGDASVGILEQGSTFSSCIVTASTGALQLLLDLPLLPR